MKIERSYPALSFISGLYKFLAFLTAAGGALIAFNGRGIEAFMGFVGGAIGCVTLLAFSELLKLFIHIEENTRKTSNLLDKDNDVKPIVHNPSPYQEAKEPVIQID